MGAILPLKKPRPDSAHFLDVLMGRARDVPPLVEYLVDDVVMKPIVEGLLGRTWVPAGSTGTSHEVHRTVPARDAQKAYLDTFIEFWLRMGYDFVRFEQDLGFPEGKLELADTAPGSTKQRAWADQHQGAITSWSDFESYR